MDIPAQIDKARVQRFLGIVGYVHKFIPNMANITKSLSVLLWKDIEWQWQFKQNEALKKPKDK